MTTATFAKQAIRPGDLIEWVYKSGHAVVPDKQMWSSLEMRWCHIGSKTVHLCVGSFSNTIVWLNDMGLFHVHLDNAEVQGFEARATLSPRPVKLTAL